MKNFFGFLMICAACCSCQNKGTVSTDKNTENAAINDSVATASAVKVVLGSYVGDFGDNKITVLITKATTDSIEGRSIVGGNDQTFEGVLKTNNSGIEISANEPETEKHDGIFKFAMSKDQPDKLTGSWQPYKADGNINGKTFSLTRRSFVYNPKAGEYPQGSSKLLKDDDLSNLMKTQLERMRNEIFARHGYTFSRKLTRAEFETEDWYVPNSADVKNELTEIEKKNIVLIKKYEKYALDYGDEFGR